MKITARLERSEPHDRRSKPRHTLRLGTNIKATGENVSIHDISSTGMLMETGVELAPLDELEVDLPENGPTEAVVIWSSGRFFGCEFKQPLSSAAMSAAFLRSTPEHFQQVPPTSAGEAIIVATSVSEDEDRSQIDTRDADERLPLPVRAIVIVASAVLLWALTIWAAEALVRLVDRSFG